MTLLGLLILSAILFQGSQSLSERKIDASLDPYVRQKRIIDISHNRDESVLRQHVSYVVLLINQKGNVECTGSILKANIILTAAHCIYKNKIRIVTRGRQGRAAKIYNVVDTFVHRTFDVQNMKDDLALVMIDNPIDLVNSFHRAIELYDGILPPNSHGLVSGYGCTDRNSATFPSEPLSIVVPILSNRQCQNSVRNLLRITPRDICTLSPNRTKCCGSGDSGAPLVVRGHLVGVFSSFHQSSDPDFPDIFMNLLNPDYKRWVENWTNHFQSHRRRRTSRCFLYSFLRFCKIPCFNSCFKINSRLSN